MAFQPHCETCHLKQQREPKTARQQLDDEDKYEFKINLIEVIQMYPEIYDIQSAGHKKDYIRNHGWQKVAEAMHAPGN